MPHEEIHAPPAAVGRFGAAVAGTGNHQQLEVFVRFHQRVGDLHRRGGINVAVQFADDAMIGETVVSIGNPFGLENSVSSGVISGARRKFLNGTTVVLDDLLQTDAAVNEGSSGGALLNLEGRLVGINLAIIQNAQNVGFAIASDKVKNIIKEYDNYKKQKKTITIPVQ